MIGRRKFLKLMGVGTAAAPVATKAALEQEAISLMSLGKANVPLASTMKEDPSNYGMPVSGNAPNWDAPYRHIRLFGIPKHVDQKLREQANYVSYLDPDLACKRSWSLAIKIMTQRERNYQQLVESHKDIGAYERAQAAFEKISGFRWPW